MIFVQDDPCDDARLDVLLNGDESSNEFRRSASHVESCETCQQRLADLAGDGDTWDRVCELLAGYPEQGTLAGEGEPSPAGQSAFPELDFLSQPGHPEMLGRLGRYEIERVIGSGGMGVVLKGFDAELNRPVAIKVLARHLAFHGAARQRFAREARAAAAVVHEHVVTIHDVEPGGNVPFLVMQYVPGESLQSRVDRDGPLETKEVLRIGIQAAAGLAAAHEQGVVHRDVKPANILLENSVERALLTDFGLARTVDDASLTHTGIVAGTPHYMSPEQAGGGAVDPRTDLFSLGAVLYFMATGRPPFRAERAMGVLNRICHDPHRPVWQVNPDIPDAVSDVIDRLLEKKPTRRFATADAVKHALTNVLHDLQRRKVPPRRRGWLRHALRHRARLLAAAATLGVAAVVALVTTSTLRPGAGPRDEAGKTSGTRQLPAAVFESARFSEIAKFKSVVSEVDARIRKLESLRELGNYQVAPAHEWSEQIMLLKSRLDRLQGDMFPTTKSTQTQGEER